MDRPLFSDLMLFGAEELIGTDKSATPTNECRYRLHELQQDYHFFNHGLLFTHGLFVDDADPVMDWWQIEYGDELCDIMKQPYDKPIFSGLTALTCDNTVPWNNVICAVPKQRWSSLLHYLSGIAIHDPKTQDLFLVYYGEMDILDPAEVDRRGVLHSGIPTVPVTVFCLDGIDARYEFRRPLPYTRLPEVVQRPPREEMKKLGVLAAGQNMSWLADRANPAFADFMRDYNKALKEGPKLEICDSCSE